jgi:hypothetical protein
MTDFYSSSRSLFLAVFTASLACFPAQWLRKDTVNDQLGFIASFILKKQKRDKRFKILCKKGTVKNHSTAPRDMYALFGGILLKTGRYLTLSYSLS